MEFEIKEDRQTNWSKFYPRDRSTDESRIRWRRSRKKEKDRLFRQHMALLRPTDRPTDRPIHNDENVDGEFGMDVDAGVVADEEDLLLQCNFFFSYFCFEDTLWSPIADTVKNLHPLRIGWLKNVVAVKVDFSNLKWKEVFTFPLPSLWGGKNKPRWWRWALLAFNLEQASIHSLRTAPKIGWWDRWTFWRGTVITPRADDACRCFSSPYSIHTNILIALELRERARNEKGDDDDGVFDHQEALSRICSTMRSSTASRAWMHACLA